MISTVRELDVRPFPPAERHALVFKTFDELPQGGSFVLIADHEARPLYYQLRAERPGIFLWVPLIGFKTEIMKLAPKDSEVVVSAFFERDHAEIDTLFVLLRADVAARRPAAAIYDDFNSRLERHIRWEEEILFPAVEAKVPTLGAGPGRVMRQEHEEIRRLKALAETILHNPVAGPGDYEEAAQALASTLAVLLDHNRKEEVIYYPMADQVLSPFEARALLARVRALV